MSMKQRPQGIPRPRRGMPFATKIATLLGGCLAIGLAGGASAHALLAAPEVSTDTTATPQEGLNDGASSSPSPTPTASTSHATTPPASSGPQSSAPVSGAYAGAGGPRPSDAMPVTTFQGEGDSKTAVISSPSGNIGCDLSSLSAGCGVQSLLESGKYGSDEVGTRWFIPFAGEGDGVPRIRSQGGAANYMLTEPQVVPYGTAVYYMTFVCASETNGMTCWDTSSGRGVFVNHDTAIGF